MESLLAKKRGILYRGILTYQERRDRYRKYIKRIQYQINRYKLEIKRIDAITTKIRWLASGVKEFTNTRGLRSKTKDTKLARAFFYKYGMEKGLKARNLEYYLGVGWNSQATEYRKWLDQSIKTDSTLRQKWENFKIYMENY